MTSTTTRRRLLAGLATLPITAAPVTTPEALDDQIVALGRPDPVFAAIESYRSLRDFYNRYDRDHSDEADAPLFDELMRRYRALLWTRPSTVAGVVALLGAALHAEALELDELTEASRGHSSCDYLAACMKSVAAALQQMQEVA